VDDDPVWTRGAWEIGPWLYDEALAVTAWVPVEHSGEVCVEVEEREAIYAINFERLWISRLLELFFGFVGFPFVWKPCEFVGPIEQRCPCSPVFLEEEREVWDDENDSRKKSILSENNFSNLYIVHCRSFD
jgi:hypothetical protein